jgi:hypothetical protein
MNFHYLSRKSSPFGPATASAMYGLFYFVNVSHNILENFKGLLGDNLYLSIFKDSITLV